MSSSRILCTCHQHDSNLYYTLKSCQIKHAKYSQKPIRRHDLEVANIYIIILSNSRVANDNVQSVTKNHQINAHLGLADIIDFHGHCNYVILHCKVTDFDTMMKWLQWWIPIECVQYPVQVA